MIISYMHQLERTSAEKGVTLAEAFKHAGLPSSTLSRMRTGKFELRQATAERAMGAIYEISQERPRGHTEEAA